MPRMRTLLTTLLLSAVGVGCGGSVSGASHDGGGPDVFNDAKNPQDGGGPNEDGPIGDSEISDAEPWSAVCPASAPTVGSACSQDMLFCEYGDAWWNVACDTVVRCYGGQWIHAEAGGSGCLPAPGPNPPACPTSGTAIGPCPEAGLTCNYLQGVVCQCLTAAAAPDAGPKWDCIPEPGCPTTRPRLGSPCTGGVSCTYELCAYMEICQNDVWQPQSYSCQ